MDSLPGSGVESTQAVERVITMNGIRILEMAFDMCVQPVGC